MQVQAGRKRPFIWYDVSGSGNALAPYQSVSLATPAQAATANAAGVRGSFGDIIVLTPISGGLSSDKVLGISARPCKNGEQLDVVLDGTFWVSANGAWTVTTSEALVIPVAQATRTNNQTPLTSDYTMRLQQDPAFTITYAMCMAGTPALPTTGTRVRPLGYALGVAAAQYDRIAVEIDTTTWVL